MIPVLALVGRPNVGKSTLFNRLTKTRNALVANLPGLTRDRQYGECNWQGRRCILIDTGGLSGDEEGIDEHMANQSRAAIEEADAIILLLDSREGLTAYDQHLASQLRRSSKPVYIVANKIDGVDPSVAMADFYRLGFEAVFPMTATHGKGVGPLMEAALGAIDPDAEVEAPHSHGTKIAIVGRPNVGKSTLVNRILGEERVVVFDEPGTTRDSVYIDYHRDDTHYTLIDTAGVRKRKNIKETVEKFSIVKTLQAISDANVAVLVIDAREGVVDQDLHLLGHIIDAGRAVVIAVNKWDGLANDARERIKTELDRRLQFIDYAEIHFISALHGSGVGKLYGAIDAAWRSASADMATHKLTTILEGAVKDHQPPMANGRRIKLRYAHAGGSNPPLIVIHGNQTEKVPASYTRYLEKVFRRELDLQGTPIRVIYKTGDNPYAEKKNVLSKRQMERKARLVRHVKKADKKRKNKR